MTQERSVWAPSWSPTRSRRYAEDEAQVQADLTQSGPR